jgi:hypothetical protein
MDDYRAFWADLVEVDGKLDLRKVAAELHDYHYLIKELPGLYDNLTGGAISKPNTRTDVVLEYANARAHKLAAEFAAEVREHERDELAAVQAQHAEDFRGATILLSAFLQAAGGTITVPGRVLRETGETGGPATVYRVEDAAADTVTYTTTPPLVARAEQPQNPPQ